MKPIKLTFLTGLMFIISAASWAEAPSRESVKELLQVTGAGNMAVQMMEQMIPSMKRMVPDAPDAFWEEFASQVDGDELEDMVIPIYQKHLTQADVDAQLKFLQSDAGQKMIKVQPMIMQESMMVGQEWGIKLMQRAQDKLKERQV